MEIQTEPTNNPEEESQEKPSQRIVPLEEEQNLRPDTRSSWWRLVLGGAIALAIGLGLLGLIVLLAQPLEVIIVGITIASSLAPVVNILNRRMPRTIAVLLVYVVLLLILSGIGLVIIPPLVEQVQQASTSFPTFINQAQQMFNTLGTVTSNSLINMLTSQFSNAASTLVTLPVMIFSSLFDALLVLFISVYGLLEAPGIQRFIVSLFSGGRSERVTSILEEMTRAMGGYVRGAVINGLIIGTLTYIGLLVIGVQFPIVLGLLAGVLEMIPFLGPIIAAIPTLTIALLQSPTQALFVLIYVIILHQFESNILVPNIMHSQTEISPLFALLALLIGFTIGGILGALTTIPLFTAVWVLVKDVLAPAIRKSTGASILETDKGSKENAADAGKK